MVSNNEVIRVAETEGVILGTSSSFVWLDIGMDGLAVASAAELRDVSRNEKVRVYIVGADPEELYLVSLTPRKPVKDWKDLEAAFERRAVITGHVSSFIKGGFIVDVGRSAFMPTSKSGGRDREEREGLIGKEILCTIEELEGPDQDIIVDRRRLLEAAQQWGQRSALEELKVGVRVRGKVCTLTDFGAFIDLGGIDGLVHVRDIAWKYLQRPSDVLSLGQEVEALVEKVDAKNGRVALSIKALQPDPWGQVSSKYHAGERVQGTVTSVTNSGAFVELEPGVEGLVHTAALILSKNTASETLRPGVTAEFFIVDVNAADRRIGLSQKQFGEERWKDIEQRFPVGTVITGTVTSLTSFGAFVAVEEGIEGLIHVSDISHRRVDRPQDVLSVGQVIRAQVLESDSGKRKLRLGIKQLKETEAERAVELVPPIIRQTPDSMRQADFTFYSKSVFINCSTHEPHRGVTEAIAFAVLDVGFVPRLQMDQSGLISAVRECQFAIHDVSRPFEMGFFMGCKEYASDIHRMKNFLLVTSGMSHEIFGNIVYSHANDPAKATHFVASWLSKIGSTPSADVNRVWARYQQFQQETVVAKKNGQMTSSDPDLSSYIQSVSEWLATHRGKSTNKYS